MKKTHAIILEIDDVTNYRIESLTDSQRYALTRDLLGVLTTSLDLLHPCEHYEFGTIHEKIYGMEKDPH